MAMTNLRKNTILCWVAIVFVGCLFCCGIASDLGSPGTSTCFGIMCFICLLGGKQISDKPTKEEKEEEIIDLSVFELGIMTVADLIKELQKHESHLPVYIRDADMDIMNVPVMKNSPLASKDSLYLDHHCLVIVAGEN